MLIMTWEVLTEQHKAVFPTRVVCSISYHRVERNFHFSKLIILLPNRSTLVDYENKFGELNHIQYDLAHDLPAPIFFLW